MDIDQLTLSESVFDVFRTLACQLGLGLTLGTLVEEVGVTDERIAEFASALTTSLNQALRVEVEGLPRMVALSKDAEEPLNRIANMNTPRAGEFRYLWLEILCSEPDGIAPLTTEFGLDPDRLHAMRDLARQRYHRYLTTERVTERLRTHRDIDREALAVDVGIQVHHDLRMALAKWCSVDQLSYDAWLNSIAITSKKQEEDEEDDDTYDEG